MFTFYIKADFNISVGFVQYCVGVWISNKAYSFYDNKVILFSIFSKLAIFKQNIMSAIMSKGKRAKSIAKGS